MASWILSCACAAGCSEQRSAEPAAAERPLRIGTTMHVKRTNPVADYYYNILAMLMTHDSLVRFDQDLQPVPRLASAFSSDAQGQVWTFELAADAKWHDGRPVTPEDVRFTFSYLVKHDLPSRWIADLIDTLETTGRQVIFRLKHPYSPFLINAGFVVRILPRHIWENIDDPYRAQTNELTIGCGPYLFDAFEPSAGVIRFRANPAYHGGPPAIDSVEYRVYGTMDVLALALQNHQVDLFYNYASGLPALYMRSLDGRGGLAWSEADSMGIPAVLGFNFERPLLQRLNIRRAIALAMDYPRLNQCLMDGKGKIPGPQLVPPAFPHHADLPCWVQDTELSKALLAGEGLTDANHDGRLETADGESVSLALLTRSDLWGDSQVVKLLAHDLEQVGVQLTVQAVDLATWQALLQQGRYDLVLFRTTPWGMLMHAGYGSGYFDSRTAGGVNACRLNDPEFFRLCDRILAGVRADLIKPLYLELQSYYATYLPAVALCWGKSFFPFAEGWQGFQVNQLEGGLANSFSWRNLKYSPPAAERKP